MHMDQILLPSDLEAFGSMLEYKPHSRLFYISCTVAFSVLQKSNIQSHGLVSE